MLWKMEAIEHLKYYELMKLAVTNISEELKRLELMLQTPGATKTDKVKVHQMPEKGEDKVLNNLVRQEELKTLLETSKLWVEGTKRALGALAEEERMILTQLYIEPVKGAVEELCKQLNVEQSSIYRKRDRALYRFTVALYGAR